MSHLLSERPIAETNDVEVFDAGVKLISEFGEDDLVTHFIYCGRHYFWNEEIRDRKRIRLREIFLTKMGKYGIQSATLTMLHMHRRNLVTKEKSKQAYEGKLRNEEDWKKYEQSLSIHDDLEIFFENLQNQTEIQNEKVTSFFLPKLTEDELKLVEEKNERHLASYWEHYLGLDADVDADEMKRSDSASKYVHVVCVRHTFHLAKRTECNLL